MNAAITLEPCAKVNLRLAVLAREASGFHGLETLFCGISLSDRLTIERAGDGIALDVEGDVDTGPVEQNLVYRAAARFFEAGSIPPAVRIRLEKRVPVAAGLGGGSADAAATLHGLQALYDEPLTRIRLLRIAADLGSDVPFFMSATPFALAWSRGERMVELPPLPTREIVIANPGVAMPTPAVFSRLAELRSGSVAPEPHTFPLASLATWDGVAALAINDFETVAFERVPRLTMAVRALIDAGADVALLSGSGACIFGIFAESAGADRAERGLAILGLSTWRARTLSDWPRPTYGIDQGRANA